MQKILQEVMSDMPEAYVKKAEIVVTIKKMYQKTGMPLKIHL